MSLGLRVAIQPNFGCLVVLVISDTDIISSSLEDRILGCSLR